MGIFEAILRLLTALSGISGCWYMFKSSDPALILDKLGKLCETGMAGIVIIDIGILIKTTMAIDCKNGIDDHFSNYVP